MNRSDRIAQRVPIPFHKRPTNNALEVSGDRGFRIISRVIKSRQTLKGEYLFRQTLWVYINHRFTTHILIQIHAIRVLTSWNKTAVLPCFKALGLRAYYRTVRITLHEPPKFGMVHSHRIGSEDHRHKSSNKDGQDGSDTHGAPYLESNPLGA